MAEAAEEQGFAVVDYRYRDGMGWFIAEKRKVWYPKIISQLL